MELRNLNDQELIATTKHLVQVERDVLTKVLHHLREIERRKLYCDFGCRSLFDYVVKELRYSEGQAGRRIQAMRLIQEIPEVEQKIQSGALSLSNISQAQSFFREASREESRTQPLNKKEKREILERLEHKSARDGQRELLQLQPENALPKEKERILTDDHTEIKFVANKELKEKLDEVRSLLGPAGAFMSFAELIAAMTEMSVQTLQAKKFGKKRAVAPTSELSDASPREEASPVPHPQPIPAATLPSKTNPRYIPKDLQHKIWHRDGGKCAQCKSNKNLNIDHIKPVARGGVASFENLRLLCFSCNQRAGIRVFGLEQMDSHRAVH